MAIYNTPENSLRGAWEDRC